MKANKRQYRNAGFIRLQRQPTRNVPRSVVSNSPITEEELFLACGVTRQRIAEVLEGADFHPPPESNARANGH